MPDPAAARAVHFAPHPEFPFPCGLSPNDHLQHQARTLDPELVRGCAVCEAAAIAAMSGAHKNLFAIFMGCGCELTSYALKEPGVVMVPHRCQDHGGYPIGQHPDQPDMQVLVAPDDEVRRIWRETLDEFANLHQR